MQTFARLFSIITFLLSLGFIAQALPTVAKGGALAAREYSAPASYDSDPTYGSPSYGMVDPSSNKNGNTLDILAILVGLKTDIAPILADLETAADVTAAKVQVDALVLKIKGVIAIFVGVKVDLAAEVKAKIAALFVEIFLAIVKVCASVSIRLGAEICLSLWASIDVCLHSLLLVLNVCVDGCLKLVIDLCVNLDVECLTQIKVLEFDLIVKLLALVAKLVAIVA